jgi:hypothetical protein
VKFSINDAADDPATRRGFSFDKARAISETNAIGKRPNVIPMTMEACKHPRVRVLTREEDSEFVECLECGEVFDSEEFADMAIEERNQIDSQQDGD